MKNSPEHPETAVLNSSVANVKVNTLLKLWW